VSDAAFTVGALPAGVAAPATGEERRLYRAALDLESVFTKQLVDAMMKTAGGDDSSAGGTASMYRDMGNDALNDALTSSGGLGLAGTLYASMKDRT
jgi:Rod binding domain-containing protein